MSEIIYIETFRIAAKSAREHCIDLGLPELFITACEREAVKELTAGRSPAVAIGKAKQMAERFSNRPRLKTWKQQTAQPSVSPQGGA